MSNSPEYMKSIPLAQRPYGYVYCVSEIPELPNRRREVHSCQAEFRDGNYSAIVNFQLIDIRLRPSKSYGLLVFSEWQMANLLMAAVVTNHGDYPGGLSLKIRLLDDRLQPISSNLVKVIHSKIFEELIEDWSPRDKNGKILLNWHYEFACPVIEPCISLSHHITLRELIASINVLMSASR